MTTAEEDRQAARELAALATTHVGWASRDRLRRALLWVSRGRLGRRHDWPVIPVLGTPWQDNPSVRGIRWRERAAYLNGQPVFSVDYQVCRRCRVGWVEEPGTEEGYERCGLAAAGLAALRAEHPAWHGIPPGTTCQTPSRSGKRLPRGSLAVMRGAASAPTARRELEASNPGSPALQRP